VERIPVRRNLRHEVKRQFCQLFFPLLALQMREMDGKVSLRVFSVSHCLDSAVVQSK